MFAAVLALAAGMSYGVADFFGGLSARSWRVFPTTLVSAAVAGTLLAVLVAVTGGAWSSPAVIGGALAALFAASGFLTFYAALAAGPISLIAPLIALLNSAVPVVWSLAGGTALRPLQWIAVAIAVAGSVLLGGERGGDRHGIRGRTLVYAVVSGLSFGFGTVALDLTPAAARFIPVFLDAAGAAVLLGLLGLIGMLASGRPVRRWLGSFDGPVVSTHGPEAPVTGGIPVPSPARSSVGVRLAMASGLLTGLANALLMLALHSGDLAVVAVLNNLYPLSTVVLAWIVLRERLSMLQTLGALLAVAASILLGLP